LCRSTHTNTWNIVAKKDKKPRAPSAYNQFMKKQLEVVKKSNPNLDHKEAFKVAAQAVLLLLVVFSSKY
jgi:hypothetical protein